MTTAPSYRVVMGVCYVRRPTLSSRELRWVRLPDQVEVATLHANDRDWASTLMQAMVDLARESLAREPEEVTHYRVRVTLVHQDARGAHQLHLERTQIRHGFPTERSHHG